MSLVEDSNSTSAAEIFSGEYPKLKNKTNVLEKIFGLHNRSNVQLKNAILFAYSVDTNLKAEVYKVLYDNIKLYNLTSAPEILLLQKSIDKMQASGLLLEYYSLITIKMQVDADCSKIIEEIVEGIKKKDYSISIYITESVDRRILAYNMLKIAGRFATGSLENTLQLIEYSIKMSYIPNQCFVIDALFTVLKKRNLLDTEQAMHLWAHAKYTSEESTNFTSIETSTQELCTDAVKTLSPYNKTLYQFYQRYVEGPDKPKLRDLHTRNPHLFAIVSDFVLFYYKGDGGRLQILLKAANTILYFLPVGRYYSQLHLEMYKWNLLNSFDAFTLYSHVKRQMSLSKYNSLQPSTKKPYEQLKNDASECVRQLLWPKSNRFFIISRYNNKRLTTNTSQARYFNFRSLQKFKSVLHS